MSSPCSICLTEKIADPANLDGCSHTYCFNCIINWAERTNTCPTCKSRFRKITRKKNGKITEVEEREQGTNYTIEDAENDYGDSASEESEYGAAHPFIDEEAESGEETSEDEVEAQKECNRWAGYLNCEDERFEKRSSEEEDEALSDQDFAHMENSDYDYDDFVVPDDDVSVLTDASSYSSERGRVKRRRLKRARRSSSSSSSSSEIHISVEEEESIDEDQPRRKRRRIDDDDQPDPEQQVKNEATNSPIVELQVDAPPTNSVIVTSNNDAANNKMEIDVDAKPVDTKPPVAVEGKTTEVRTKKRKRSKRKGNREITSSDGVPASQCTPVSVKNEAVTELKEDKTRGSALDSAPDVKQDKLRATARPIENKAEVHSANNAAVTGETKKKRKKKKKKKNKSSPALPLSQGTNGTSSQVSQPLSTPTVAQSTVASSSGDATQTAVPKKKKKKNKKKKNKGLNGTNTTDLAPQVSNTSEARQAGTSNNNTIHTINNKSNVEAKNHQASVEQGQHTSDKRDTVPVPQASVQHKAKQVNSDSGKLKDKKQKKSTKSKSSTVAVNGGRSEEVRLSFEEKRSAEERYQQLKKLIAQM